MIDLHNNQSVGFDACCLSAHNECMSSHGSFWLSMLIILTFQMHLDISNQLAISMRVNLLLLTQLSGISTPKRAFEARLNLYRL